MTIELRMPGGSLLCEAVLFDMDGVLVDSLALIDRQLREWADEHGVDVQYLVDRSAGRTNAELIAEPAPDLDA
jgi:sugar-phosphatase